MLSDKSKNLVESRPKNLITNYRPLVLRNLYRPVLIFFVPIFLVEAHVQDEFCKNLTDLIRTTTGSLMTTPPDTQLFTFNERNEAKYPFWIICHRPDSGSNGDKVSSYVLERFQKQLSKDNKLFIDDARYEYLADIMEKCEARFQEQCDWFRLGLLSTASNDCPICGSQNEGNCDNVNECTSGCGQIKSVNYPLNYKNNHRCHWSIRAPENYYVNLTIIDFDIPSLTNTSSRKLGACIFDYLTLIDGYTGKRLGCYCNDNLPPPYIVSPWNELIIQFDTNSETSGRGFYFQYEIKKLELSEQIKEQLKPPMSDSRQIGMSSGMANNSACLNKWQYFRGSCYRAFNDGEPLQWYDAENRCNSHGKGLDGHLVSILDEDEMLVIHHFLTNVWNSDRYRVYYIGLIDVSREGLYKWSDNNPMSYTDWELRSMLLDEEIPAQPDGGAYEDCTIIRYNSFSRRANWHDVPCSLGKHYHSHLEKSPPSPTSSSQFTIKWEYVDSYICKTDSIPVTLRSAIRRPLFSNEFKLSTHSSYLISHLAGLSSTRIHKSLTTASPIPVAYNSAPVQNSSRYNGSTGGDGSKVASAVVDSSITIVNETISEKTAALTNADVTINEKNRYYLSALDDNRYFVCDNLEVISVVLRCDGVAHCRDGSDESIGCDQDCLDWQFKCANGRCIPIGSYCDFVDDCGDGSDESRCERHRCKLNEFRCQSGQCIASSQRCDLLPDCNDVSDEGRLCTIGSNCNTNSTFQCYNGNCIPLYAVCDFQIDCPGKFHEDEDVANCEVILKNRSLDYNHSYAALPAQDTSPIAYYLANQEPTGLWIKQNQFKCNSGNMIDASMRCLYEFDRYGYQIGCRDVSHLIDCQNFECPQRDYVKCSNSYCIPWRYICDGKWDCIMGDDEVGCARYVCPGQYKCANQSSCILLHQLCDGHRQCPMGDDEWFCDLQCPFQCDCIGQSVNCKGANLTQLPGNYISKSVRKLDLSYNRLGPNLSTSDFSAYHDLGELILNHNGIEVLIPRKFNQLRNLYKLDLSNNHIHSVKRGAFAGLRRVTQLLLESNPDLVILETEAFLGLSSLQILNISSSRIRALRKNTFDGLTSLRHLQLRSNMIIEIEDGAFRSLNSLLSLDMRGNDIRYFTKLVFSDLKSLRNLSTDSFKFCCLMNQHIPTDRCLPLPDEISDCEDLLSSPLQRTCNWIAGSAALIGNLIVIVWRYRDRLGLFKERQSQQVNSMLLLSLGCSDLIMGLCQITIAIVDSWYRGRYIENADNWRQSVLCNLCGFLSTIAIEASFITLVLIARNRYTEICHPFNSSSKFSLRLTYKLILISWCLALLIATLPLLATLYTGGQFYARSGVCLAFHITNQKATGWLYSLSDAFNLMAFIYIATCYMEIYMETTRHNSHNGNMIERPTLPLKIALILFTHFVACLPAIILRLLSWAGVPLPATVYSWIAVLVLPVNSAINPMIYTIPSIRRHIHLLIQNYRLRKSGALAARSNSASGQLVAMNRLQNDGLPKKRRTSESHRRMSQFNIPPGYMPLEKFIRQTDRQIGAEHLVKIAYEVARDLEAKHAESKVYTTLELDNIFVSDKIVGKAQHDPSDAGRGSITNGNSIDQGGVTRDLLSLQSSGQSCNLTVFLSNSYKRIKGSQCSHDQSSSGKHLHHHWKNIGGPSSNCECADVRRFGEILLKLVQLYNDRKSVNPGEKNPN